MKTPSVFIVAILLEVSNTTIGDIGLLNIRSNLYLVLWLASVFTMVVFVYFMQHQKLASVAVANTAFIGSIIATLTLTLIATLTPPTMVMLTLTATTATTAVVIAALAAYQDKKSVYYTFVGVYGVAMAVSMSLFLFA